MMLISCVLLSHLVCGLHSAESTSMENSTYATPQYLDVLLKSKQFEKFSKLVGFDPKIVQHAPSYPLSWMDVIIQNWQVRPSQQSTGYQTIAIKKWDRYEVPYSISTHYTILQQRMILACIGKWNREVAEIKYRPRRHSERDYVFFFSGNGCFTSLGRRGGPQGVSLMSNTCLSQRTILHEMLHAVGIPHEHSRPDRDNYIQVLYNNIPKDDHDQYEKMLIEGYGPLSTYDFYSLMHYPMRESNGRLAFRVLKSNIQTDRIGKGTTFTYKDLQNVKRLYGDRQSAVRRS